MAERDIYIAIMVAASRGKGLNLSCAEVAALSCDNAIETAALNGLDDADWPGHRNLTGPGPDWKSINARKTREPANLACIAPEDRP